MRRADKAAINIRLRPKRHRKRPGYEWDEFHSRQHQSVTWYAKCCYKLRYGSKSTRSSWNNRLAVTPSLSRAHANRCRFSATHCRRAIVRHGTARSSFNHACKESHLGSSQYDAHAGCTSEYICGIVADKERWQ